MKWKSLISASFYLLLNVGFALLVNHAAAQTPPSPPSGLWIFDRSHVSFQVSWNAPNTDGGAPVTNYEVRYRVPDPRLDFIDAGYMDSETTMEITGLAMNTSYEVQVRAISADGKSDWSPPQYTRTLGWQAPLTLPSDLVASGIADTSFRVSWIPPYTVDGAVLTGYEVTYRLYAVEQGVLEPVIDAGHTGTEPFFVITGLNAESIYDVQVVALTSDGKRHYSPHLFVTTSGFRPSPPSGLTVARTPTSLLFNWNAPQTPDDIPITGYDVRYRPTAIQWVNGIPLVSPFVEVSTNSTDTTFELTDLAPSTSYEIGVRTVVANSKSSWSPVMYAATRNTFRMNQPFVSERTRTSFRVSWSTPNPTDDFTLTGYRVRYRPAVPGQNAPSPYIELSPAGTETTIELTGLTPSTGYEIGLQAVGANGNSLWSNSIYDTTYSAFPINAPSDLVVSEKTHNSFRVSWDAPNAAEGITIAGYEVRYRTAVSDHTPESSYTEADTAGTETTIELTNLSAGASYEIGVRALGAIGNSVWSVPIYVMTYSDAPIDAPSGLTVVDKTSTSLSLSWNAAKPPKGTTIAGYEVRYRLKASDQAPSPSYVKVFTAGTGSVIKLTNLTPDTDYEIEVRVIVENRNSVWSDPIYAATYADVPIDAPAGLLVVQKTSTSLRVSWDVVKPPEWIIVTGYRVRYRPTDPNQNPLSSYVEVDSAGTGGVINLTNLRPNTVYEIGVRTLGESGNSVWSHPIYEATSADIPIDAPSGLLVVQKTSTSLRVVWDVAKPPEGITVTGYRVRYRPTDSNQNPLSSYVEVDAAGTGGVINLTNLRPNTVYEIGVRTISASGNSDWSDSIYAATARVGDLNGDGAINILDLTLVAANLGRTGENMSDLNGDGVVDIRDLVLLQTFMNAGN